MEFPLSISRSLPPFYTAFVFRVEMTLAEDSFIGLYGARKTPQDYFYSSGDFCCCYCCYYRLLPPLAFGISLGERSFSRRASCDGYYCAVCQVMGVLARDLYDGALMAVAATELLSSL